SIRETSLLKRLQTYSRFPSGVMAAPVAVCPTVIAAVIRHARRSMTATVLFGAAQVTINFIPSGLRTRPVGSAGMSSWRVTFPVARSTQATCRTPALATYKVLASLETTKAHGPRYSPRSPAANDTGTKRTKINAARSIRRMPTFDWSQLIWQFTPFGGVGLWSRPCPQLYSHMPTAATQELANRQRPVHN